MPQLIPTRSDSPGSATNREAWQRLAHFDLPFKTAFGAKEPTLRFVDVDQHFQRHVNGAAGQHHERIPSAGHYLQEDAGEHVAATLNDFIAANPR
jgi:haloalkane dehalogenase